VKPLNNFYIDNDKRDNRKTICTSCIKKHRSSSSTRRRVSSKSTTPPCTTSSNDIATAAGTGTGTGERTGKRRRHASKNDSSTAENTRPRRESKRHVSYKEPVADVDMDDYINEDQGESNEYDTNSDAGHDNDNGDVSSAGEKERTKACIYCKISQSLIYFFANKNSADGKDSRCTDCYDLVNKCKRTSDTAALKQIKEGQHPEQLKWQSYEPLQTEQHQGSKAVNTASAPATPSKSTSTASSGVRGWSESDADLLLTLINEGNTYHEVADAMERSYESIKHKSWSLGYNYIYNDRQENKKKQTASARPSTDADTHTHTTTSTSASSSSSAANESGTSTHEPRA
jgi:hypothetical protein